MTRKIGKLTYLLSKNPSKISRYSLTFLTNFDFQKFIDRKIENTEYIYKNIDKKKYELLFKSYNSYILTGFPLLIDKKDKFQETLKKNKIETLAYKKFWFHCNRGEESLFQNEIDIHNKIVLLPINETIAFSKIQQMVVLLNNLNFNK